MHLKSITKGKMTNMMKSESFCHHFSRFISDPYNTMLENVYVFWNRITLPPGLRYFSSKSHNIHVTQLFYL